MSNTQNNESTANNKNNSAFGILPTEHNNSSEIRKDYDNKSTKQSEF